MDPAQPLPTAPAPSQEAIAWCLLDAQGRETSASDAERPFYAASTIKLHVLLAALRAADRGELDLASRVRATRTFAGEGGTSFTLAGDHLDPTHPREDEPVAVRDLLVRMIDRSSNEATDHVISLVGLDAVAEVIAALGLSATRVQRLIGDPAALEAGLTNETCAADLAQTLHVLVRGDEAGAPPARLPLSAGSRTLARDALGAQQIRIIGRALRADVPAYSKSGWVEGYRHDVAAVGDPESGELHVLAVMTAGLAEEAADERILGVARDLLPADVLG
jgi:beta-lactamase class A